MEKLSLAHPVPQNSLFARMPTRHQPAGALEGVFQTSKTRMADLLASPIRRFFRLLLAHLPFLLRRQETRLPLHHRSRRLHSAAFDPDL